MYFMRLKKYVVIEGKTDVQARGPPNIEQPIVVQKKRLKKNTGYVIILSIGISSHMYGIFINKKHDNVFGEIGINLSVLESNYSMYVKKYVSDISLHHIPYVNKSNLVVDGIVIDFPLMYGPMRNHHLNQIYFSEENQETNMGNLDVDKNVPDIMSDMLTKSQIHK